MPQGRDRLKKFLTTLPDLDAPQVRRPEEPPKREFSPDIGRDISRLGAFGQDITLQPRQPDVDFTATVETMKLPGETMNKGIQQMGEGDPLTGALNIV